MTTTRRESSSFFKDLTALLTGRLVLPEDAAYEQARQLWNGRVTTHPAALVRCANVQDVIHTVRWARSHGLALSVRGGGHDFAGRALCDDGIVIDCSQMRAVTVDPATRTARIQGGAMAGDLIDAAQKHGLATTTGTVSSVGMAGLTLGGGYGPLMSKYGLAIDNLLSAQVVTADGQCVSASAAEHADLFWGLRGGGGNFGVVVSLEYRLHPVTKVLSGLLLYPLDQAREVLTHYNEFIKSVPDELTIMPGFIQLPDGMPVLFLSPVYCGPLEEGERVLTPLRTIGKPLTDQIQPVTYDALINAMNALVPKGRRYFAQTQSLDGLRSETIEALVDLAQQFSSPFSAISLHHFHGVASRVAASDTAFALRQDHLMAEIIAGWEPAEDQRHVQWARAGSRALAPYAFKEGYVNMLDAGEQERVPLAFGPNYERLLDLKRAYDPDDVFRSTIGHITPTVS
ncbi:MAG TPA: FAD-binding oxidoreductase [Ktedonobacteraceae bacterium]